MVRKIKQLSPCRDIMEYYFYVCALHLLNLCRKLITYNNSDTIESSRFETLDLCWHKADPLSATQAQHHTDMGIYS